MNSNACTAWASRFMRRWSAPPISTARAASMRRSVRTRRCSPISCGACWRTAPTPPSSIASPTPRSPIEALLEDPVDAASALDPIGAPHPKIALPRDLFGAARANSAGLDLSNEARLSALRRSLRRARRSIGVRATSGANARAIVNPADASDIVGACRLRRLRRKSPRRSPAPADAWPAWRDRAPSRESRNVCNARRRCSKAARANWRD